MLEEAQNEHETYSYVCGERVNFVRREPIGSTDITTEYCAWW